MTTGSVDRPAMTDEMNRLLSGCDEIMVELEEKCCVPRRSPQMARLKETLSETRELVGTDGGLTVRAEETVGTIENAGAQIGRLQVTCCAPSRMPLYDELLHNLMKVQRLVKQSAKLEH